MPRAEKATLQTIAEASGFSRMTVSLALRKNPRIPEATRLKIAAEAERQGYTVNPLLASWMARVRRGKAAGAAPTLAYLTGHPPRGHRSTPHLRLLLQGTRRRAEELGFNLKEYYNAGNTPDWDTVAGELPEAGVVGLILAPFPDNVPEVCLPWERFCAVAVGHSAKRPTLHTVTDEQLDNTAAALASLEGAGYRRIGLINYPHHERLHSHGRVAAYLDWQQKIESGRRIPVLRLPGADALHLARKWYRRYRPEIVLSPLDLGEALHAETKDLDQPPAFLQLGRSQTEDQARPVCATMEPNLEVGIAAVDMLAGLIYRHEPGIPEKPHIIEVPGILSGNFGTAPTPSA